VLLAIGAGQLLKSQLFNVAPMNPLVIAGVAMLLAMVAILATMIPAWRASTINPIIVLGKYRTSEGPVLRPAPPLTSRCQY
jgi:ABC-type antimicrobial peptide transport system permease subunit